MPTADELARLQGQLKSNAMGRDKPSARWAEVTEPAAVSPTFQWQNNSSQCAITADFDFAEYMDVRGGRPTDLIGRILGYSTRKAEQTAVATLSTASWLNFVGTYETIQPHGLIVGQAVVVEGALPGGYNGTFEVFTTPDATTFTVITTTGDPGAYVSDGSVTSESSAATLSRVLPWVCPYVPWMYAVSVSNVQGVKFKGRSAAFSTINPFQTFDRVRMIVTFSTLPYDVISDTRLRDEFGGDESYRFVEKPWRATAEYISVNQGFFRFAQGAPGPPGGDASLGQRFPLGTAKITVKVDLEWTWHNVPEAFIFNRQGLPTNIVNGFGCVNDSAIWGYPAGTLLCLPAELTPIFQPVNPTLLGHRAFAPPRAWNVKFLFKFWDPPRGVQGNGSVPPTARGHNLALWPDDAFFYLIKSQRGDLLFKEYDFARFFQAVAR